MPLSSRGSRPWPFLTDIDRTKNASRNSRPSTAVQEVEAQQLENQATQVFHLTVTYGVCDSEGKAAAAKPALLCQCKDPIVL